MRFLCLIFLFENTPSARNCFQSSVFWNVMQSGLVDRYQLCGGVCFVSFQDEMCSIPEDSNVNTFQHHNFNLYRCTVHFVVYLRNTPTNAHIQSLIM